MHLQPTRSSSSSNSAFMLRSLVMMASLMAILACDHRVQDEGSEFEVDGEEDLDSLISDDSAPVDGEQDMNDSSVDVDRDAEEIRFCSREQFINEECPCDPILIDQHSAYCCLDAATIYVCDPEYNNNSPFWTEDISECLQSNVSDPNADLFNCLHLIDR